MTNPKLPEFAIEVRTLIHDLTRVYNEADREEKACCNLTLSQYCTLLAFDPIDAQLTMNALSSRLGLSTSTMTRHVDGLVHKGHIKRVPSDMDRRQVLVRLTKSEKGMTERLRCCELNLFHQVLQSISRKQLYRH